MADHVYPEDSGTSGGYAAEEGDYNDAANFASAFEAVGLSARVSQGIEFTPDFSTPDLVISTGKAVVNDDSASAAQGGGVRDEGVSYVVEVDARTGLSLTAGATNYVYLDVNLNSKDAVSYHIDTDQTPPSAPYLLVGEVDTTNNRVKYHNRAPNGVFDTLSLEKESQLTNGTFADQLSFESVRTWREIAPNPQWDNILQLDHEQFDAEIIGSGATGTNLYSTTQVAGSQMPVTIENGEATVNNSTGSFSSQLYKSRTTPITPFFGIMGRVENFSGTPGSGGNASDITIGLAKDGSNFIACGYNVAANQIEIFQKVNGAGSSTTLTSGYLPTPPFEMYAVFAGDEVSLLTREVEPQTGWNYHGTTAIDNTWDLFDVTEFQQWRPMYRWACAPDLEATISDWRVFNNMQFGVRDPTIVTYKDGSPYLNEGYAYLTVTTASASGTDYLAVLELDLTTYEFTQIGALFCESWTDYVSNFVDSHIMYDNDRDKWFIFWDGNGNGDDDPSGSNHNIRDLWVSELEQSPLRGTRLIPAERMNVPTGSPSSAYSPFVFYDESAQSWRLFYNSAGPDTVAVAETTDTSFTSGWTILHSYSDGTNYLPGCSMTRINGSMVLTYADPTKADNMCVTPYPDPSTNRNALSLDTPTGASEPHPTVVPIPNGDKTKYLLISSDESTMYGDSSTTGSLWVYEAAEQADGYEFTQRSHFRR